MTVGYLPDINNIDVNSRKFETTIQHKRNWELP